MGYQWSALKPAGELAFSDLSAFDQRSEDRFEGLVDRALLVFRGQEYIVPVINISSRGTMIEAEFAPRIGENLVIRFHGCSPIQAFVRWQRDGRLGLNFGHEIVLA